MLNKILKVATRFKIFPCSPATSSVKRPLIKDWANNATQDPATIKSWWAQFPDFRVGIPTGSINNIWVVDTDVDTERKKDGESLLKDICNAGDTLTVKTPRGGFHRYYELEPSIDICNSTSSIGEDIDVRGEGGFVIAPPSKGYKPVGKVKTINGCSSDLFDIMAKLSEKRPISKTTPAYDVDRDDLEKSFSKLDPANFRDRDSWMKLLFAAHHSSKGEDWGKEAFKEWSKGDTHEFSSDPDEYIDTMWAECKPSSSSGKSASMGTIKYLGSPMSKDPEEAFEKVEQSGPPTVVVKWDRDSNGKRTGTPRNMHNFLSAATIGKKPNDLKDLFKYNELSCNVEFSRKPPWEPEDTPYEVEWPGKILEDEDYTALQIYMNASYNTLVAIETVFRGILHAARCMRYHPVKEYLEGLTWDGVERVDEWLMSYLSAPDTVYIRIASTTSLISAVARIYQPGCEVHTMIVLEGKQGTGKSATVKILGGEFYASPDLDIGSKDAIINTVGSWILEMEEMECASRAETKALKKFVSCPSDKIRKPYARAAIAIPRQSIFIGTINPPPGGGYLKDETGSRRFLPVSTGKINFKKLERDRDQLWAEARHRYLKGERWHLSEQEAEEAVKEQHKRRVQDPWQDEVIEIIEGLDGKPITTKGILNNLGVPSSVATSYHARRVVTVLTILGYAPKVRQINGKRIRQFLKHGE